MNNGVPLGSDFQLAEDASTEGNSLEGRSRQGAKQPVTPAAGPRLSPEVEEHLHNMKLERDAAFALVDAKKAELQKKLADMSSDYSAQFDSLKATLDAFYMHHAAEISESDHKHQDLEQRLHKASTVVAGINNMIELTAAAGAGGANCFAAAGGPFRR